MSPIHRIVTLIRRRKRDAEMTEEMQVHVDLQTQRNLAAGMKPDEARFAALREFGNAGVIQQQVRESRGWGWLEQLGQDLRYALRQLTRAPGFAAVVIVTLALSIAACLVIFSVADSLLLHPLDNPEPDRLVTLRSKGAQSPDLPVSPTDFVDWRTEARSFASIGARATGIRNLTGEGEPRRLRTMSLTANYFEILGLKPALGRAFLPEETTEGNDRVVMVSHAMWQNDLGGRADVIGRAIRLNEENFTIVGVLPANIDRAGGQPGWSDIAVPLVLSGEWLRHRGVRSVGELTVVGRLKAEVSAAQAQVEMDVLCERLAQRYPETNRGIGASVTPTEELMTRAIRPALWSLLGAVAGVLLIACANIASLLLVRATIRHREISLRTAFGATRSRLIRLLLAENLVLALVGGGTGTLLALGGIHLLGSLRFHSSVGLGQLALVKLDPLMLGWALGLSLGAGLLFGLIPALLASRGELSDALKHGARGSTETGARGRLRSALVVFEIAAALTLLVCAGLLVRSFVRLANFDPGFDPRPLAYANVSLQGARYRADTDPESDRKVVAFADAVLARLRATPGVESADVAIVLPAITVGDAGSHLTFTIAGRAEVPANERSRIQRNSISPGYFATLGIPLVRGRAFTAHDTTESPRVAIISESAARLHFPGEDPIGQRIRIDSFRFTAWSEIVGVVADTVSAYGQETVPQAYEPFAQTPVGYMHFAVRTAGDPAAVVPALKPAIHGVDPELAVPWAQSMSQTVGAISTLARQRFIVQLLALFSGIALVIAMVGIYGVISYSVSRRTTEIGIRMALGATVGDVLRLVLGQGARLLGLGLLLGVIGSIAAGQAIESMLYHTSAFDPVTLVIVVCLLAFAALLASWLPARRAAKVDPMIALRAE